VSDGTPDSRLPEVREPSIGPLPPAAEGTSALRLIHQRPDNSSRRGCALVTIRTAAHDIIGIGLPRGHHALLHSFDPA
jgi:hypothetical protein